MTLIRGDAAQSPQSSLSITTARRRRQSTSTRGSPDIGKARDSSTPVTLFLTGHDC